MAEAIHTWNARKNWDDPNITWDGIRPEAHINAFRIKSDGGLLEDNPPSLYDPFLRDLGLQ